MANLPFEFESQEPEPFMRVSEEVELHQAIAPELAEQSRIRSRFMLAFNLGQLVLISSAIRVENYPLAIGSGLMFMAGNAINGGLAKMHRQDVIAKHQLHNR